MSHFVVVVVGDDYESQLAPFQENNMGDCPEEYLQFTTEVEAGQEAADQDAEMSGDRWITNEEQLAAKIAEINAQPDADFNQWRTREGALKGAHEDLERYRKYRAMSPAEFMKEYHGYQQDENGNWGYTTNPNSHWDWYQVGGRWSGFLQVKPEFAENRALGSRSLLDRDPDDRGPCAADQARFGEIDWEGMREAARVSARKYWAEVLEKKAKNEGVWSDPTTEFPDVEAYAESQAKWAGVPFAVVKDGEWIERGQMGWWAVVTDEKDKDAWAAQYWGIISQLPPDTLITVVDCHV